MEIHRIHPELLKHRVRVLVVGCGGNKSAITAGLPYRHQALLAYGHPEGIGCVDTRAARGAIAKCAEDWNKVDYWLDLGNNAESGQFILGEPLDRRNRRHRLRLRTVSELFPKVTQQELDEDDQPSCSAVEALDLQEPFVNPTLANHTLVLLARLFRYGTISYHGGFLSLSSLSGLQALRIDPKYWQRMRRKAAGRRAWPVSQRLESIQVAAGETL
jgi:hypothetical protein